MRDYIASLAEKCAGTSLTDGQKDFVLDYVKAQLTEGYSLVAEAVNAMDEHKVEFGLNIDWDALEDEDAVDRYDVYESISDEVFNSNATSGYIEAETGETMNWYLDVTKDGYDISLGRLRWETMRDIADLIYERCDDGVLYDFEDSIEMSREADNCIGIQRFLKNEAENWTKTELPMDAADFVCAYVTRELEHGELIRDAVKELQNHPELEKKEPVKSKSRGM